MAYIFETLNDHQCRLLLPGDTHCVICNKQLILTGIGKCDHPADHVMLQFETIEHSSAFFSNNYYHLCKKCDRRVKPTRYEEVTK